VRALGIGDRQRNVGRHAAAHELLRRVDLQDLVEEEDVGRIRQVGEERLVERARKLGFHGRHREALAS
jgi:hypothetical protein